MSGSLTIRPTLPPQRDRRGKPGQARKRSKRPGLLGSLVLEQFAERIKDYDLKPKHVGALVALDRGVVGSQLEVARGMRVAPSLMVALADHLTSLGAIVRERDPADRRRQVLRLTNRGHELLAACTTAAAEIDAELTEDLPKRERDALMRGLCSFADASGLPD